MTDCEANDSLAVRRGEKSEIPFTAEELLILGRKYVKARRIGMSWREDAAQEFAIAGVDAVGQVTSSDNVRAFQIKAGKWAVANLWRSTFRRKVHEEEFLHDRFGDYESLSGLDPEAIIDHVACDPLKEMIAQEEVAQLRCGISTLSKLEREILCACIYEGKTQRELARERKVSQAYLSGVYNAAFAKLKQFCNPDGGEVALTEE